MKILLEENSILNDIEVLIRYGKNDKKVEEIYQLLQAMAFTIECTRDGRKKQVNLSDISYFEARGRKTTAVIDGLEYDTALRLYQVLEKYANIGFVQVNKYTILNINQLDSIVPLQNSKIEAHLKGGANIMVTRKYVVNIKDALSKGIGEN